ncbi:MAG: CheB methylesterase domain-containing protein [Polyangiaceae bacterium]
MSYGWRRSFLGRSPHVASGDAARLGGGTSEGSERRGWKTGARDWSKLARRRRGARLDLDRRRGDRRVNRASAAVSQILRALRRDFPLLALVVVHIAEAFGAALADWLDRRSPLRVACARDGDPLPAVGDGRVLMTPADSHLVLRERLLRRTRSAERHSCCPSVDILFESIAQEVGPRANRVLLTGIGKDGPGGLLAVRRAGGLSIGQDEATSVIYGMPREAVALGAAQRVLPVAEIGPALVRLTSTRRRKAR